LTAEEKKIVTDRVEGEKATLGNSHHSPLRDLVSDPKVWVLCLIYFLMLGAVYALIFSMPSLVRSWGVKDLFTIGWLQAIPSMVGVVGMILIGRSSDRTGDRRWHYVFTIGLIAFGLTGIAVMAPSLAMSIALLSIATIGTSTATPLFFTFVSEYLPKETAAGGIAFVSSLGNIGPSITPSIFTWVVGMGGSAYGLMLVVVMYSVAGVIMAVVGRARRSAAAEVQYA
jgi:nitrate/nitrite transporter NarK